MKIITFEDFMKKNKLKKDTMKEMNEFQLQKFYNYPIYPKDSKTFSNKRYGNIDIGSLAGPHCTCFIMKDNKSFYFDSFGGVPDKFLLKQLPKSII